jgi:HTH-type transcriptional regulator / antitoxin HigA
VYAIVVVAPVGKVLTFPAAGAIRSDRENERLIALMERIDTLPRPTAEEKALSELIAVLVEEYERRYDLGPASPVDALKSLMEDRGVRQRDLIPVFGSSSVTSDVLKFLEQQEPVASESASCEMDLLTFA